VTQLSGTRPRLPRPAAVTTWITGALVVHALTPVAVARRYCRLAARPHPVVRLVGVGGLLAGTAGVVWSLAQHFEAVPEGGYELTLVPEYLLHAGPYRFSRHPMYVSEVIIWVGWSLLLANPVVGGLTGVLALGQNRAAAREEASLAARFGDTWQEYAARTPRWIGWAAST
jgi:protein-S-isoprenylcysteine O-methyltransferase Ste14